MDRSVKKKNLIFETIDWVFYIPWKWFPCNMHRSMGPFPRGIFMCSIRLHSFVPILRSCLKMVVGLGAAEVNVKEISHSYCHMCCRKFRTWEFCSLEVEWKGSLVLSYPVDTATRKSSWKVTKRKDSCQYPWLSDYFTENKHNSIYMMWKEKSCTHQVLMYRICF